ncbi:hypothetical protein ACI797_22945 [Geodermatophilus sp. SYSU D00691]
MFAEPAGDGMVTLGARLPADEAAEALDLIGALAAAAKADGDARPIGQLRAEIYSLLARGAAAGLLGARARLLITASLETLEGSSTAPSQVNGQAITPAHLAELLRRTGALGLSTPEGGKLAFALTDAAGRLLGTVTAAELRRLVLHLSAHPSPLPPMQAQTAGWSPHPSATLAAGTTLGLAPPILLGRRPGRQVPAVTCGAWIHGPRRLRGSAGVPLADGLQRQSG